MITETIQKICPITGFSISENPRWNNLKLAGDYIVSFRKIGDHIVDVHGHGNIKNFDAKKFQNFLDRFIRELNVQMPYVEMRNYEDIHGIMPTRDTLNRQKDYFIENCESRVGFVAYHSNTAIELLLKSGQRQYKRYNVVLAVENTYEEAVFKSLEIIKKYGRHINKNHRRRKFRISDDEIERVAILCGSLLWEGNSLEEIEDFKLDDSHPLYPIVENLYILKEELTTLEADAMLKNRDLEHERIQTEKIVESLQSGIMIVDRSTDFIIDSNPASCKLLNCTKEQIIGQSFWNFVTQIHGENNAYNMNGREFVVHTFNGEKIPVLRSSVNVKLAGKEYRLENFVDNSDAKKHEEKLEKSLAHTRQLNNLTFNREKRIIEMKAEVNALLRELGRDAKYKSSTKTQKD